MSVLLVPWFWGPGMSVLLVPWFVGAWYECTTCTMVCGGPGMSVLLVPWFVGGLV